MGSAAAIEHAVAVLSAGGLVAFPTETVYGLGADATNPAAVARIFAVKGRPTGHPLIVHLAAAAHLDAWAASVPDDAGALADALWPGPLTLVLHRGPRIPDAVTGGRDTVGLRVPAQPLALALLDAFGGGIAAPSANRFGRVSPTTAADVRADLGDAVDVVLDGGPCAVGVESTIVDLTVDPPMILRPGGVSAERIEAVIGRAVQRVATGPARAPGMLAAHYAPRARVEIVTATDLGARAAVLAEAGTRVGVLAVAPPPALPAGTVLLDTVGDADTYARVLYTRLRDADRHELDVVLAVAPPPDGVGVAVADRLRRAAAGGGAAEPGP